MAAIWYWHGASSTLSAAITATMMYARFGLAVWLLLLAAGHFRAQTMRDVDVQQHFAIERKLVEHDERIANVRQDVRELQRLAIDRRLSLIEDAQKTAMHMLLSLLLGVAMLLAKDIRSVVEAFSFKKKRSNGDATR